LVVEIDGSYHNREDQKQYDKERTEILESFGLKELRFTDDDVLNRIDRILDQIRQYLTEAISSSPPCP
jgi:very-short-patch-repair endonuclease